MTAPLRSALFALLLVSPQALAQDDERLADEAPPALVPLPSEAPPPEPESSSESEPATEPEPATATTEPASEPATTTTRPAAEPAPTPAPAPEPAQPVPTLTAPGPTIPAIPELPPLDAAQAPESDALAPGTLGYYALWYGPEWGLMAVLGGLLGVAEGLHLLDAIPPAPALIGPLFNDTDPDDAVLTDPRLDDVIGRPFLQEKVPAWTVGVASLSAIAGAGVIDAVRHGEVHHTHNLVLGGITAVTVTQLATLGSKALFGRLRPDFRDRYAYASCQGQAPRSPVVDCDAQLASGFVLPDEEYAEGYRSFPSGHASASFAGATYLSLWLGSELVWNKDAGTAESVVGALGISALYSAALFTSATRLSDNKHHPEDVAVGAGLGAGIAAASWFLHFDINGNARWRGVDVAPGPGDAGLALVARF